MLSLLQYLLQIRILFLSQDTTQNKRALIIAIVDYEYWSPISSANDVPLVKKALLNQGFKQENIDVIQDEFANRDGIVKSIENLYKKAKKDGFVLGNVTTQQAKAIKEATGINVSGFKWELDNFAVRHIYKRHPETKFNDFVSIYETLNTFDKLILAKNQKKVLLKLQ